MYEGLQRKKITSTDFVLDLALMCDALQELSELSLELQDRNVDLYAAKQKIKALVQVFKERRVRPGPYYEMAAKAVERLQFQGVSGSYYVTRMGRGVLQKISHAITFESMHRAV